MSSFSFYEPFKASLYIHIPFCRTKCVYCDFYSLPRGEVPDSLIREIREQYFRFREEYPFMELDTLFIGGGTPTLLTPKQLLALLELGGKDLMEVSVEGNPESLSREFLEAAAAGGVTRISLGLQSWQEECLALLGRPGRRKDNARALELLDRYWPGEVNFDLMAGLPGQEEPFLLEDLARTVSAHPGHISFYSLTLEEGTGLFSRVEQGEVALPPDREELWLRGMAFLKDRGYRHYEISNFALPGKECRHNLNYWKMNPYLGLGPGAVSTMPGAGGKILRLTNPPFPGGAPEMMVIRGEDFLMENLMMGLRLERGLSRELFLSRFSRNPEELFPGCFERWRKDDILGTEENNFYLKGNNRLLLDRYLIELMEESPGEMIPRWPERPGGMNNGQDL